MVLLTTLSTQSSSRCQWTKASTSCPISPVTTPSLPQVKQIASTSSVHQPTVCPQLPFTDHRLDVICRLPSAARQKPAVNATSRQFVTLSWLRLRVARLRKRRAALWDSIRSCSSAIMAQMATMATGRRQRFSASHQWRRCHVGDG